MSYDQSKKNWESAQAHFRKRMNEIREKYGDEPSPTVLYMCELDQAVNEMNNARASWQAAQGQAKKNWESAQALFDSKMREIHEKYGKDAYTGRGCLGEMIDAANQLNRARSAWQSMQDAQPSTTTDANVDLDTFATQLRVMRGTHRRDLFLETVEKGIIAEMMRDIVNRPKPWLPYVLDRSMCAKFSNMDESGKIPPNDIEWATVVANIAAQFRAVGFTVEEDPASPTAYVFTLV